eukprot:jgi/Picsp_1/5652/NSC_03011-R1_tim17 domain-containing protein
MTGTMDKNRASEQQKAWYLPSAKEEEPDMEDSGCLYEAAKGLVTGFAAGSLFGAVFSNWSDVPVVLRDKPWPALMRTGSVMAQHGSTLGVVGLAFAGVDCAAESIRGKKDWLNGVLGSVAGGAILGMRSGKMGTALMSMAALAATSAAIDLSNHSLRGEGFQDAASPVRRSISKKVKIIFVILDRRSMSDALSGMVKPRLVSGTWRSVGSRWVRMASGGLRMLPRQQTTDRQAFVCWNSLDDMAEREMAKLRSKKSGTEAGSSSSSQKKKDQFRPNDFLGSSWEADPMQSWDGVDGSVSLLDTGALSSLPYGDDEAAEAAAAASEGVPTYRGSGGRGGQPERSFGGGGIPVLPTSRAFRKPGSQTPEEAALEDYLMEKAVDEGMALHHARLERAHSRYAVASAFGEILEQIEQEDVWRNSEPLLPGTELKMPTWIRASEAIAPLIDELNEKIAAYEMEQSEIRIQEAEDQIIDQVEAARKLLSLTDPRAGLPVQPDAVETGALDELFGDLDTLLPGASNLLEGEEGEMRRMVEGQENSIMNSLLEEILPEVSGYALDYADLIGKDAGGNQGMLSGALQALSDEVDTALEEVEMKKESDEETDEEVGEEEDVDVEEDLEIDEE